MAKIKLNAASGGGSVSLQAPSSSSNDRVYTLPDSADITTLAGILEFDSWYHTVNYTGGTGVLSTNLARNNFAAAASQIGTGMTESSGVFTFPRTGKYLVIFNGQFALNGSTNIVVLTQVTTNNGASFQNHARALDGNNGSGERSGSGASFAFIDVTDTSQVKVKFHTDSIGSGSGLVGSTNEVMTTFLFIRLGDT